MPKHGVTGLGFSSLSKSRKLGDFKILFSGQTFLLSFEVAKFKEVDVPYFVFV